MSPGSKRKPIADWSTAIANCPLCGRDITGHLYSLLATDVIDRKEGQKRLIDFFEALKSHDWKRLLTFQTWEGGGDNVELFGVLCGSNSVVLVVVRSPVELYERDQVLAVEVLDEDDSKALLECHEDKDWKELVFE